MKIKFKILAFVSAFGLVWFVPWNVLFPILFAPRPPWVYYLVALCVWFGAGWLLGLVIGRVLGYKLVDRWMQGEKRRSGR